MSKFDGEVLARASLALRKARRMTTKKGMRLPRDLRALIRMARRQGWTVEQTNGNHYRFVAPSGESYVTSYSPSDWRAVHNLASALRSMGLKPRGGK